MQQKLGKGTSYGNSQERRKLATYVPFGQLQFVLLVSSQEKPSPLALPKSDRVSISLAGNVSKSC